MLYSASPADAAKNRIQTFQTAWEEREDGVYQTVAATRNNAAGNMLSSAVKRLFTESAVLQNRQITIDERGHEWAGRDARGKKQRAHLRHYSFRYRRGRLHNLRNG